MIDLTQKTASQISSGIAERLAMLRKRRKISQKDLASRSGVSYGSLKRFERTGEISLTSLGKLAIALEAEEELDHLFGDIPPLSIEEVLNGQELHRQEETPRRQIKRKNGQS